MHREGALSLMAHTSSSSARACRAMRTGEWGGLAWEDAGSWLASACKRPRLPLVSAAKLMARTAWSCRPAPHDASAALFALLLQASSH